MNFKRYPSIENSYRGKFVDIVKMHIKDTSQTWVVSEKIHGANYSIWSDGLTAKAAKRSDFIRPESGERFYAHEPVFEKYKDAVIAIAKEVGFPIAIYGELFGGSYNGQQATNATKIQKEVEYCPHIDWFIYDIMDVENEGYLPIAYVHMLAETYGLTTVPVLGSYLDLEKALAHKNDGLTVVPRRFGLPDIEGNVMEGIVITPTEAQFLTNGSRIIFKSKSEGFIRKAANVEACKLVKELSYNKTKAVEVL